MNWLVNNLWLIPVAPLLAAGLIAVSKQRKRSFAAAVAIGSMAFSFLIALAAFILTLLPEEMFRQTVSIDWMQMGETSLRIGWILDPLTACMLVMVTFVGGLIFIYSTGYMAEDRNYTRFFCFLSLFAAAMLGLVISNSLLLLFICWELVGLASYLLIGFWYHKPNAAAAAKKAFITTRIGDVGFFVGMLWLYTETGTLLFYDGGNGCLEASSLAKLVSLSTVGGMAVSTAIGLLIFCGAIGKSGQVPLHVWLPDAMEGPTPVSALIHAATMVAAGVFLIARVYPLMAVAPVSNLVSAHHSPDSVAIVSASEIREDSGQPGTGSGENVSQAKGESATDPLHGAAQSTASVSSALRVVTWVGAITALFAALIAVAQTDIKRILAYSTVSQLGYMFMGIGVGGIGVGMFHLITHAFFKALLFLGAGSVICGCHHEQDIRRMGGIRKYMPVTFATYAIGMMALSGIPLFFSGFWSKDEILHGAWLWPISKGPFILGLAGAFLTAYYMTRQMCFVFFGNYRGARASNARDSAHVESELAHHTPHESPPSMTRPLVVLAVFAILLGVFGTPAWPWFEGYLAGHSAPFRLGRLFEFGTLGLMAGSTLIVLAGIGLSWWHYGLETPSNPNEADPLEQRQPRVFAVLRDKFYVDELYSVSVIRLNAATARFFDLFDRLFLRGIVQGIAAGVNGLSWLSRAVDEFVINLGFDRGCRGVRWSGSRASRFQGGKAQSYLRVLGVALVVLMLFITWGGTW